MNAYKDVFCLYKGAWKMELKRYEEIRDESKKAVQDFLNDLPEHFTMMHLEVLKITFQEELEKKMSDLKMKTKLR